MEEKGDAFNHRLARQSSNTDLGMPLWALSLTIFSLPCYALALLQSSRITGAFVRAQQPSSGTGENRAFQQQNQLHWETASIPPPPPLILFPRPWGLMHVPAKAAKPLRGGVSVLAHARPQRTPEPRCIAATWMLQGLKQPVPLLITASPGPGASLCCLSCM